jgi:Domain of unknown function (DUF4440)
MRRAVQSAVQRWWLSALIAGALIAVFVELKAQPAPGDDATVLAADQSLDQALRTGDKAIARRLLSLQFTFVDENGQIHPRREFLNDLTSGAGSAPTETSVKTYGRIVTVSGHRKTANDNEVFFVDIWARQKGTWRALVRQDVQLASEATPRPASAAAGADSKPYECKNPCEAIPYRVRSPLEQDIISSFQAIEKASIAHDADEWSKHVADEFVLYGTGRAPIPKSGRIETIKRQKENNTAIKVGEVEAMRLSVYGDAAAMTASHAMPDSSRPAYRATRVWVKRHGQWEMAISVQTDIK